MGQQTLGSISGSVVTEDAAPQPVSRAIVTLGGGDLPRPKSVITDSNGRFSFRTLPAGRFTLTATKPAYISSAYGAKRHGRPGTPITLAPGQQVTGASIRMSRGAVITGTLRDAQGDPAPAVQVVAIRVDQPGTSAMSSAIQSEFVTDDRGMFRIFGLLPGDYIIGAGNATVFSREMTMPSAAENDAALRVLTASRSANSGAATGFQPVADPGDRPAARYIPGPIFFPGTLVAADAVKLTLKPGDERVADFSLQFSRSVSVTGVVTGPPGSVEGLGMNMAVEGPPVPPFMASRPLLLGRPAADGKFAFSGVRPGKYVLTARTSSVTGTRGGGAGAGGGAAGEAPASGNYTMLWARADLEIVADDIEGVALTLQPGMKLRGRVAFDATTLTPPSDLTTLHVSLSAPDLRYPSTGITSPQLGVVYVPPGVVGADGTFEVTGIMPGAYRVAAGLSGGWWLRSAVVNGRDVLDGLLEFGNGGNMSGAVLTFTDKHSELSGLLQTPVGAAAPDYFVIAFPADRALWHAGSRRMQSTRPATDGHFTFKDLPGGEYLLAALIDLEPSDLDDVKFLESVSTSALKVAIGDGEKKVQDLRLAR